MARKKVPPETIIIDDRIDERAMTAEERQKAMKSLIKTVSNQAVSLSEIIDTLNRNEEEAEQLEMQLEFPSDKEEIRRKHIEEARHRYELARQEGALDSGKTALATISDKTLGFTHFTSAVIEIISRKRR